jgi:hypothetical protein
MAEIEVKRDANLANANPFRPQRLRRLRSAPPIRHKSTIGIQLPATQSPLSNCFNDQGITRRHNRLTPPTIRHSRAPRDLDRALLRLVFGKLHSGRLLGLQQIEVDSLFRVTGR